MGLKVCHLEGFRCQHTRYTQLQSGVETFFVGQQRSKKLVNPQEVSKSDVVLRVVAHWSFTRIIGCIYRSAIKNVALIPDYWCQIVHKGNFRLGFFRIPRL